MSRPLSLGISPCPNDTFIFHAWAQGLLPGAPSVAVRFADVDEANQLVADGQLDVAKVSCAALPWLLEDYTLVPAGGALGHGCGPMLVTAGRTDLAGARVAVPGERTTAYLLFRLWSTGLDLSQVTMVPFDRIMPGVRDGEFDAGLVIHEARFTYPSFGLSCLVDLGEWWEHETDAAIPLGAIVCRRDVDREPVTDAIRRSLQHAWDDPAASRAWVMAHAQEMDDEVVAAHIELYVTSQSMRLDETGFAALRTLFDRSAAAGLIPPVSDAALR